MSKPDKEGTLRIGTAGYAHETWRGCFYPEHLDPAEWLEFYAGSFDTVELDATFYRLPSHPTVHGWRQRTPDSFLFALRGHKVITHNKMLAGCAGELTRFRAMAARFGSKLGPILWQLAPTMPFDPPRLERFLGVVTRTFRARQAVEFRDSAWHKPETFDILRGHGVGLALTDARRSVIDDVVTADFVYVRRHGPGGVYRRSYNREALRSEAKRIQGWTDAGLDVYVYFANEQEGHALANAGLLREMCAPTVKPPMNAH